MDPRLKPRLLDLFAGEGGAARGYQMAGFDVTGVDIVDQPRYVGDHFHKADAVSFDLAGFDAYHASPPCQEHHPMGRDGGDDSTLRRIRHRLQATGRPYVIENVIGARKFLHSPLMLHGAMFGLDLYRPRLFESNVLLFAPPPCPPTKNAKAVYGDRPDNRIVSHRVDGTPLTVATLEEARTAMGMPWADWHGLTEAIPPPYTEWIGRTLIEHCA